MKNKEISETEIVWEEQIRSEEIKVIRKQLENTNLNLFIRILQCISAAGFAAFVLFAGPSMGASETDLRHFSFVAVLCILAAEPVGIYKICRLLRVKNELKKKLREYDAVQGE